MCVTDSPSYKRCMCVSDRQSKLQEVYVCVCDRQSKLQEGPKCLRHIVEECEQVGDVDPAQIRRLQNTTLHWQRRFDSMCTLYPLIMLLVIIRHNTMFSTYNQSV